MRLNVTYCDCVTGVRLECAAVRAGTPAIAATEQDTGAGRESSRRGKDLYSTVQIGLFVCWWSIGQLICPLLARQPALPSTSPSLATAWLKITGLSELKYLVCDSI